MQIKTVNRIIDDNGIECRTGDTVLIKTNNMYDALPATIDTIMTGVAVFIVDDPIYGTKSISARPTDVVSIIKHEKRRR